MAFLPSDPQPSGIQIDVNQPTSSKPAIDGISRQVRSREVFKWKLKFSYSLLDFDQADILDAFLIDQKGGYSEFDVLIPTRSNNEGVTNTTGTSAGTYPLNTDTINISGMVGALKPNHLLRVNGKKSTYVVMSATPPIGGTQQVRIKPPLRDVLNLNDVIITKNVPMNVYLDDDVVKVKRSGMSASVSFTMIEQPR